MTFMVVDTDSYDVLLGLHLLIKIGVIVDVEQGLIQVRRVVGLLSLYEHGTNERMVTQESDSDSVSNGDCNEGTQLVGPVDGESEFGNTELENLVMLEGPQQILQLTLQKQADDLMKEDITDVDDYANWIEWAVDAE
ncbi:unnamed protein product [Sphagnum tenellum]